jgi:hypothetical protein
MKRRRIDARQQPLPRYIAKQRRGEGDA